MFRHFRDTVMRICELTACAHDRHASRVIYVQTAAGVEAAPVGAGLDDERMISMLGSLLDHMRGRRVALVSHEPFCVQADFVEPRRAFSATAPRTADGNVRLGRWSDSRERFAPRFVQAALLHFRVVEADAKDVFVRHAAARVS
jgi:hypothetical protein